MIIQVYHLSNDTFSTKVFVNERKDSFLLITCLKENEKKMLKVSDLFSDKDKLIKELEKNSHLTGYGFVHVKKNETETYLGGNVTIGYGGINQGSYDYIDKSQDTINNQYYREFFIVSDAFTCKDEEFYLEKEVPNKTKAVSYIIYKK